MKSREYALYQRAAFSLRKVAAKGTRLGTRMGRSSQYCSIWKIQASKDSPFFPEKGGGRSGFKWTKWEGTGSRAAGAAGAAATGRALRRSSMHMSWSWRLQMTTRWSNSSAIGVGVRGRGSGSGLELLGLNL